MILAPTILILCCYKVKEEFSNDSEFLNEYSVSSQKNTGGPAAPEAQSQPA